MEMLVDQDEEEEEEEARVPKTNKKTADAQRESAAKWARENLKTEVKGKAKK